MLIPLFLPRGIGHLIVVKNNDMVDAHVRRPLLFRFCVPKVDFDRI